jgi:hypothetical protein
VSSIGDAIRSATEYLSAHPGEARYTDSAAVATLDDGLKVTVTAPDGRKITTGVRARAKDADPAAVRELVDWAITHCPVCDATKRAVPMTIEIDAS